MNASSRIFARFGACRIPMFRWFVLSSVFLLSNAAAFAQTYTFNPAAEGSNSWSNPAKWGLESGYPNGAGTVVILPKISAATTLSLNVSPTIGVLYLGPSGVGSGSQAWRLMSSTLELDNGDAPAIINNTSGANANFGSPITSSKPVVLQGVYNNLFRNTNSRFTGGLIIESSGSQYFYSTAIVNQSDITHKGTGNAIFGNGNPGVVTLDSNFEVQGDNARRGILSHTSGTLVLNGNITGTAGVKLGTTDANRGEITVLNGNNTYSGVTQIETNIRFSSINNLGLGAIEFSTNSRRLIYSDGNTADITQNALGEARSVILNVATTFDIGNNNVTYANSITGAGRFVKAGGGTLVLEGNNSFANFTLSSATVVAGHNNALGGSNSSVTLEENTTLSIRSGVNLSVKDLSLASGATLSFELQADFVGALLTVNGDQIGNGTYTIDISFADFPSSPTEWTLLTVKGTAEASSFVLGESTLPYGSLHWDQATGSLTFMAVPEPSVSGLALMGLGFAQWRLRRRGC